MHKLFEYYSLPVIFKTRNKPEKKEIDDKVFDAILKISKKEDKNVSDNSRETIQD